MCQKLTKQHLDAYLADPNICPFCGSDELKAGGSSFVDRVCFRDIKCTGCHETFIEEFVMIGLTKDEERIRKVDRIIVQQDSFLDDVESIYYNGNTNNSK